MTLYDSIQVALLIAVLGALIRPLGGYFTRVYAGERTPIGFLIYPLERGLLALAGIKQDVEQTWSEFALSLLIFNTVGILVLFGLFSLQHNVPLNPTGLIGMTPDLAMNTAVSFATNTSWQSYGGETTLSHLAQMLGITVQSFLSAATGLAVAMGLVRGFARKSQSTIGNFWVDLVRGTLYILLPLSLVAALFFVSQGVPQTLQGPAVVQTLEGSTQTIARGPVASQEAIKLLSGDGGGFFNVNSSHPFENPNVFTNLTEIVLMLLIGAAMTNVFGRMVGNEREGWVLLATMALLLGIGGAALIAGETQAPVFAHVQYLDKPDPSQAALANMEGKESRFGVIGSALFAEASTVSSDGAANAMFDSFMPLSGLVLMANMMVDEGSHYRRAWIRPLGHSLVLFGRCVLSRPHGGSNA
jgi:K+-transporting ATPase ATPase A chain